MKKSKFEEFDKQEEEKLWREFKKTQDEEIREYLIEKYSPLVKYVAGKISTGMPQSVEFDDLISYGVFGLLDAITKFDIDRGIKFKTYAMTRIRGAIFDELRNFDWIPRSIRQKAKQMEQIVSDLENKMGRPVEDEEIAEEMGLSEDELKELMLQLSGTSMVSLNDIWYLGDDNDEVTIMDTLQSPTANNPEVQIEKEEVKDFIVESIKKLPDKEKKVIVLYYYEDLTLKEIGQVLDVTESRVSQLHTKAIMRLRGRLSKIKAQLPRKQ